MRGRRRSHLFQHPDLRVCAPLGSASMDRFGMTIPFDGAPARTSSGTGSQELRRPRLHRRLVERGQRHRRLHPARPGRRRGPRRCASAAPSSRPSPGARRCMAQSVAAMAEAAPGRFAFGIGTSSDVIVERLERHPVRGAVPAHQGHGAVPQGGAHRREGREAVRDVQRSSGFRLGGRPSSQSADPHRRAARGDAPAGRPGGRRRHHQLARRRRREEGRARSSSSGWDEAGKDGKPEVVARIFVCPNHRRRHRAPASAVRHRRLPQRARVRRLPRVARPRRPAPARCGTRGRRATARRRSRPSPISIVDDLIVHGTARGVPRAHRSATSTTASPRRARAHAVRHRRPAGDQGPRPAPRK